MIRPSALLASVAFTASIASAQSLSDAPTVWTVTAGSNGSLISGTVGASRWTAFGTSERFLFGLGARANALSGSVSTTPDGSPFVPRNVHDTLFVPVSALAFNVTAHFGYKITSKVTGALDFDLLGISTGGARQATYRDSANATTTTQTANPQSPNIFGGLSSSGIAGLNVYGEWTLSEHYAVRLGYARQSVNYTTGAPLSSNTANFRGRANIIYTGISITRDP